MTTNIADQILVVDDSRAVRSIVRKILTQLGYIEVDEASDGAAAFAKMNVKPYALVISDWNMEPINGKALLVQVRSTKKWKKFPLL
jgi:two-component system, chemotaxis family, chemotaxis protein CheY